MLADPAHWLLHCIALHTSLPPRYLDPFFHSFCVSLAGEVSSLTGEEVPLSLPSYGQGTTI